MVLFECYEARKDYAKCICFMSMVKERQRLVTGALTQEDYRVLLDRQTSAVLKSQTVMYEAIICNE